MLLWQSLFPQNREQETFMQHQHQQQAAMMSPTDNFQAQQLQQVHQARLQQQLLESAPSHRFQGDDMGQRAQPFIPGFASTLRDVQRYQALQGMIAEEERLLKLRQLRQLHDLQEYQDLLALQRRSGSTRAPDFVTAAPPVTLLEASNPTSMPEIADGADDSITAAIAATIATKTSTTATTKTSTTATAYITEASVPTPTDQEEEETLSSYKRKSKKKDTKWLVTLGELKKYRQANGDCIVPRGYALNTRLASWVAEQRLVSKIR
jgi:hypothetical protein